MPVYYMSLFKMPSQMVKELEKYQRNFLWDGGMGKKDHLVNWDELCRLKEFGGLGIGHLKERSLALLAKCLWRFSMSVIPMGGM